MLPKGTLTISPRESWAAQRRSSGETVCHR